MAPSSTLSLTDSPDYLLETQRTLLRKWTPHDLETVGLIFGDPEIMENIGDGFPFSPVEVSDILHYFLDHYKKHNFGPLAVIDKNTKEVIGINGFKYISGFDHEDFGFAFLKKYWRQGYAIETSLALLEYGQNKLQLKNIGATVSPQNLASIALLKKLGFVFYATEIKDSVTNEVYKLRGK